MSNASDFIIGNGVLKAYVGPGGNVVIPSGVTASSAKVFSGNDKIGTPRKQVRIPGDAHE